MFIRPPFSLDRRLEVPRAIALLFAKSPAASRDAPAGLFFLKAYGIGADSQSQYRRSRFPADPRYGPVPADNDACSAAMLPHDGPVGAGRGMLPATTGRPASFTSMK